MKKVYYLWARSTVERSLKLTAIAATYPQLAFYCDFYELLHGRCESTRDLNLYIRCLFLSINKEITKYTDLILLTIIKCINNKPP